MPDIAHLAELSAAIIAVAPESVGGVWVRAGAGPIRDHFLNRVRCLGIDGAPRSVPVTVSDEGLLGGLDLTATLHSGHPVHQVGILDGCDGCAVILRMAERQSPVVLSVLAGIIDHQRLVIQRDGFGLSDACIVGLVALDESAEDESGLGEILTDRLGIWLDLHTASIRDIGDSAWTKTDVVSARSRWRDVAIEGQQILTLCESAEALGVSSIRAVLYAERIARVSAALNDRSEVEEDDLRNALSLVIALRATQIPDVIRDQPGTEHDVEQEDPTVNDSNRQTDELPSPEESASETDVDEADHAMPDRAIEDVLLQSALASIPAGLLDRLQGGQLRPARSSQSGAGGPRYSETRGRPIGETRGIPGSGKRLAVLATLRAAIPWQRIRRGELNDGSAHRAAVIVRKDDFRLVRFREPSRSTTIFVVDASGSAALHRLAEAKGAVEKLLADCYVRRDEVALIMFRGEHAEVLLPPTRSLSRAKRALLGLPGGGGTPLARGVEEALLLSNQVRRSGSVPSVVFLTDGKANIDRAGKPGRQQALDDALSIASQFALQRINSLVIDTSARPHPNAERLATKLGGHYLPMPMADAEALNRSVRAIIQ